MTDADGYFQPRNSGRYVPSRLVTVEDDRDPTKERTPLLSPTARSTTSSQATTWVNTSTIAGSRSDYANTDYQSTAPSSNYASIPPSTASGIRSSYYPASSANGSSLYRPPSIHSISSDPNYYGIMGVQICQQDPAQCNCGAHHSNPPSWWKRSWHDPESMVGRIVGSGGGGEGDAGDAPAYGDINRRKKRRCVCCKPLPSLKKIMLHLTMFLLLVLLAWRMREWWVKGSNSSRAPSLPEEEPPLKKIPLEDCSDDMDCSPSREFTFERPMFGFKQRTIRHRNHHNHITVRGKVLFEGVSPDNEKILASVEVQASNEAAKKAVRFEVSDSILAVVINEGSVSDMDLSDATITINAVVSIPQGYKLKAFAAETETLNLIIESSLKATVDGETNFKTISGKVSWRSTNIPSSTTKVETISGSINGNYDLLDCLTLYTKSGTIDITLTPRATNSKTSLFQAETVSGSIKVRTTGEIPTRQYTTLVSSISGSISGSYILGSSTKITSVSGSQSLTMIAVDSESAGEFLTDNKHGSLSLDFEGDLRGGKAISSTHKTISGRIAMNWPQDWEGHMRAKSMSGSIGISGEGVRIIRRDGGYVGSYVEAVKGDETKGKMDVETVSGSVDIRVGLGSSRNAVVGCDDAGSWIERMGCEVMRGVFDHM